MARSLISQASRRLVSEASSLIPLLQRRGYAVASDVSMRGGIGNIGRMVEENMKKKKNKAFTRDWAPDPVTGYYRPINHKPEIDPVDLRNMLLNHKLTSSSSH